MKKLLFALVTILLIVFGSFGCGSNGQNLIDSALQRTLTIMPANNQGGGNGTVEPCFGSHPYRVHDHVIVTATPQAGSLFMGWQGIEGVLTTNSIVDPSKPSSWSDYKIEVVMQNDVTLIPIFSRARNLAIYIKGSGTVRILETVLGGPETTRFRGDITPNSMDSHLYFDGEQVTLTVIPDSGATFTGWTWTGNVNQIDPQYLPVPQGQGVDGWMMIPLNPMSTDPTLYMARDIELTANFASNK
jgi:hypothetical protein